MKSGDMQTLVGSF